MEQGTEDEFCIATLVDIFELAYDCQVRVVGAIKEIFQHKRYIVELLIKDQVVIRCLKRYSEFEALHQVIQMNFKNIDLALTGFPSKFQVIHREETRRDYFEKLLNKIVQIYLQKITNETNRRLLSTLYVFLAGQNKEQFKLRSQKSRKISDSFDSRSGGSREDCQSQLRKNESEKQIEVLTKSQEPKPKKMSQQSISMNQQGKLRAFMGTEFLIRFEDEHNWKERYLKLQNTRLLIYKHKNENHFKSKIELFQAKIQYFHRDKNAFDHFCEKMEFDNEPLFPEDNSILTISHQYDYKKLFIMIKPDQRMDLQTVKEIFTKASRQNVTSDIEGVFSPIGKIFIILHKILFTAGNPKTLPIIYLRIRTSGLIYQTKRMTSSFNTALSIKQGFMIPISNAFANILIEVIMIQNDGIIRHESQEKCIGFYKISFADFMTYPSGQGLQKLKVKIQHDATHPEVTEGFLQISIINYSDYTSIYADSYANENDGLMMSGLKKTSDTDQLVITVDRVLRVVGNIALFITAFWRNVYLFKYPRMGYTLFSFLILFFNFASSFVYFRMFLYSFIIALLYQHPQSRKIIVFIMNEFFFKYRHSFFCQPLCLSTNELKFRQWVTNLVSIKKDYRLTSNGKIQKTQEAKDKKYEQWVFTIDEKTFTIRQDCPGLFQKVFEIKRIVELVLRMISAVINTLQKVFNVICWADPKRSIVILSILVFVANVASTYIFQAIGTIFCVHRLYKGMTFYEKKHYVNNRKLAVYSLRYIINKEFPYLLANKEKKIISTVQSQIQNQLVEIYFPIRDEERLKKLKKAIEEILGVYIDSEELEKREETSKERRNSMRLIYLVSIIESCEARLKLEWISGQEGISAEFQELKKLTNEELVIDLWVESLLINFFLNVPSQLYTTFRPIRSESSLKFQKTELGEDPIFHKIKI